ncbi:Os01g0681332, partial [Oryza sativa Japonica Group]
GFPPNRGRFGSEIGGEKPPQPAVRPRLNETNRSGNDVPEYVPAALEPRHGGRRGGAPAVGAAVRRPGRGRPSVLLRRLPRLPDLHEVLHRRGRHLPLPVSSHDRTQRGSSRGRRRRSR